MMVWNGYLKHIEHGDKMKTIITLIILFTLLLVPKINGQLIGDINQDEVVDIWDVQALLYHVIYQTELPGFIMNQYPDSIVWLDSLIENPTDTFGLYIVEKITIIDSTDVRYYNYDIGAYGIWAVEHMFLVYRNGVLSDSMAVEDYCHRAFNGFVKDSLTWLE